MGSHESTITHQFYLSGPDHVGSNRSALKNLYADSALPSNTDAFISKPSALLSLYIKLVATPFLSFLSSDFFLTSSRDFFIPYGVPVMNDTWMVLV